MELKKVCNECGIEKDIDEFTKNNKNNDKHHDKCRNCKQIIEKERILFRQQILLITKIPQKKICYKCGIEKNISEFTKNINYNNGYLNECKKCKYDKKKIRKPNYKICNICEINKSISEFYKNPNNKDGYMNRCKECYLNINNEQRKLIKEIIPEFKICNNCKVKKPIDDYRFNSLYKDNHLNKCIECYKKNIRIISEFKICNDCEVKKPIDDFYTNIMHKDGHVNKCKKCYLNIKNNQRKLINKIIPESKTCVKCEIHKSISEFYKNLNNKDGHVNKCKKCYLNIKNNQRKLINKIIPESKTCVKCEIHKSISEFYKNLNNKDGHVNKCKKCYNSDNKQKRQKTIL